MGRLVRKLRSGAIPNGDFLASGGSEPIAWGEKARASTLED